MIQFSLEETPPPPPRRLKHYFSYRGDHVAVQCELKGRWDSILNLSKSKRNIMKLLSVDDSIFFSSFIWYIGCLYVRDCCSTIIFVEHVKTVFVQVLSWNYHAAQITTPTWTKTNLTCFYKIDCCAAIHGRIWMSNVPNESRIIMLHVYNAWKCTEFCYLFFFSFLEKFGVKLGFPFFFTSHGILRDTWRARLGTEQTNGFCMIWLQ